MRGLFLGLGLVALMFASGCASTQTQAKAPRAHVSHVNAPPLPPLWTFEDDDAPVGTTTLTSEESVPLPESRGSFSEALQAEPMPLPETRMPVSPVTWGQP
jgi:hypothetical protein